MAKNQSRKPGRDVRGGKGGSSRPGKQGQGRFGGQGTRDGRTYQGKGRPQQGGKRGAGAPRGGSRGSFIEGRRACMEALESGLPIRRALIARAVGETDDFMDRLVARLDEAGVPVETVSRSQLDGLSSHGAHQGVVLETRPFGYVELADVIRAAGEGDALVVLLDHVTDEGNFGAIVRSAEVVGAAGVITPKARTASVGTAAYKTSAGAVLHLPIAQVPNLAAAIDELKEAGFWVAAATEHAEQDVWHAPMGGRLCLVMGSEGEGISRLVRQKCDFECRLPQRGRVESLNVAQATTVLCYEWLRRVSEEGAASMAAPAAAPVAEPVAAEAAFDEVDFDEAGYGEDLAASYDLDWDL